jgi:DNA-binding LacI/PurR family transcriptional regulator
MTKRRHVGIRDVAREAGVSITTVSHALNEKGGVSEATRLRVREVAERLGYRPDPRGRQLASGRTGLIALTVSLPDGVHAPVEEFLHNAHLIDAATATAIARGLALVVVPAGEATIWDRLPLDGLIVVDPVPDDPSVRELRNRALPIVTVGKLPEGDLDTRVVDNDYTTGTVAMLEHLVGAGARRVGMVALSVGESYETESIAAYRSWAAGRDMDPWIHTTEHVDWASPRAWGALDEIARATAVACLDAPDAPDALYCLSESYAIALLAVCKERGVDVPGDVMVATLADRGLTERTTPPLTSLELFPRDLGTAAAEMVAGLVDGTLVDPAPITVATKVVARASSGRTRVGSDA